VQQDIRVVVVIVGKGLVVFGFLSEKVHSHIIRVCDCDEIMRYEEEYFTFFSEHFLFTFLHFVFSRINFYYKQLFAFYILYFLHASVVFFFFT
jgi:hypothetical protein